MLRAYKLSFYNESCSCFLTGRRKDNSPVWKFYVLYIINNLVNPCAWWPLANSIMTSTLSRPTVQWEDETARERTGCLPSYAEAKKMKSLTVHTRGYPRATLRDCSSSYSSMSKNNTETKNGMKRTADGAPCSSFTGDC